MPINDVMGGLMNSMLQAAQIANQVRQQRWQQQRAMQQDAEQRAREQRQQQRQDRLDQMNEIGTFYDLLNKGARLADGGQVRDRAPMPMTYRRANPVTGQIDTRSVPIEGGIYRDANPGRTVTLPMTSHMLEIPTPDEQMQRQIQIGDTLAAAESKRKLDELRQESGIKTQQALDQRRQLVNGFGVDIQTPNGKTVRVLPSEADQVARAITAGQDKPRPAGETMIAIPKWATKELGLPDGQQVPVAQFSGIIGQATQAKRDRTGKTGGGSERPPTRQQFAQIEQRKNTALQRSTQTLQQDVAKAKDPYTGEVDPAAVQEAWKNHIQRAQDAQVAYEHEIGALTGQDVQHNDWADRLTPPGSQPAPSSSSQATAQPAKSATAADVKAYAQQKGVSEQQARQEFEQAGYRVQ